ncbi:phosphotransferase [Nocardia sp. CDC160]|uniref:phosphotransferase n=1 Tax=Nocardia sp. CDC160 TaxID=3112166 RepID=UPI002DBD7B1A|nr:phosphotransferase [Nocardia sp. CDC160]MEC3916827.1 phosphotransferase [Nocardia sp. CDC160]
MLNPPDGFREDDLARVLRESWGIVADRLEYRAVGFGSHHWEVGSGGTRWFVTVDEARSVDFEALAGALETAIRLRDNGFEFVIAPKPTLDGRSIAALGMEFAVSLYSHIDGEGFTFGEYRDGDHLNAVLDMLVALHTSPPELWSAAPIDEFEIDRRKKLDRELENPCGTDEVTGPYTLRAVRLIAEHRDHIRRALDRYDGYTDLARSRPDRAVLTHGEPHAANTMRIRSGPMHTPAGFVLIDWESARIAPPERDLWDLSPADGTAQREYTARTGRTLIPDLLEMYRLRWDLTEVALYLHTFRNPHGDTENDRVSWDGLVESLEALSHR